MKNTIIILSIILMTTGCFKKDEMLPAPEPGDLASATIPMKNFYSNQVYFNLNDGLISDSVYRSSFDLMFECIDTSTMIRLNTADFAMAAVTPYSDFKSVTDTSGLNWMFDGSTGSLDSIALSNWITIEDDDTSYLDKVYVINRGIDDMGVFLGLKKIKFDSIIGDVFYFTYCNFDNTEIINAQVVKSVNALFTQYSFEQQAQIQTEPVVDEWDLLFTNYTTMLYTNEGIPYPYLVTGVLQKYGLGSVAVDSTLVFEDIVKSDTILFDFSTNFDAIGYDWKYLTGDVGTGDIRYEIEPNRNYIVKTADSYFFKLRFVNFYNPKTGEKGYPTFQYQRL